MTKASTFRTLGWRFVLLLPLLTLYVTAFWGHFGLAWPAPIRRYTGFVMQGCWQFYRDHVAIEGNILVHSRLVWMAVSVVFGGLLPLSVMALLKRWPADVGVGLPNRWGWRVLLICLLVVAPLSFVFANEQLAGQPTATARVNALSPLIHALVIVGVSIPEHILLTGICVALFLPDYRLPAPVPPRTSSLGPFCFLSGGRLSAPMYLAPMEGSLMKRALRWLGLSQPSDPEAGRLQRLLAWWGLDIPGFWAIVGGGMLFGIVHIGARPIEFLTSFPGGMAVCYLTYRSRSIWPGWLAHIAQMIFVTLAMWLLGPGHAAG